MTMGLVTVECRQEECRYNENGSCEGHHILIGYTGDCELYEEEDKEE